MNPNTGACGTVDWATIVQAASSVVLVLITAFYVVLTWRLTKSSENQAAMIAHQYERERTDKQRLAQSALKYELLETIRIAENDFPAPIPTHVWDTMKGELSHAGLLILSEASALYAEIRRFNEGVKSDEEMKRFYNIENRQQSHLYQQGQAILTKAKYIYGILNKLETAGKEGQ